ncbi:MAG: ATP phosphoribosyltransferase regulatory subunit [Paracoccaceae bacterium]
MHTNLALRAETARLRELFEAAGALFIETDILQPADTLLDLYGEDIRARAFVTHDPLKGEQMLRPDFTVPVVQMHMADGAEPARYTYSGKVFRRQEDGQERASEYLQVGYEVFDRSDPVSADAEVFSLFSNALSSLGLRKATGDISILRAAVQGLSTTDRRKAALMRHIWRPDRFRALLERFGGQSEVPAARAKLLHNAAVLDNIGPVVGLRSLAEISERVAALRQDALDPPISRDQVALLDRILDLKTKAPAALDQLREIAKEMPALDIAVNRLAARLDALVKRGVEIDQLDFEASYGRTSMEYYDGFVFGFYDENRPDLPPVATGGRYDALTQVLGQGRSIPAVGGVIRPELIIGSAT